MFYSDVGLPIRGNLRAADDSAVDPPRAQAVVMYPESTDTGADVPYYTWMLVLTGCVVVIVLIQAGVGVCYFRRKKRERASTVSDDMLSTTTVGSAFDPPDMGGIDHAMFRPGLSGKSTRGFTVTGPTFEEETSNN